MDKGFLNALKESMQTPSLAPNIPSNIVVRKHANPMTCHIAVFHFKLPSYVWLDKRYRKLRGIAVFGIFDKLSIVYHFGFAQIASPSGVIFHPQDKLPHFIYLARKHRFYTCNRHFSPLFSIFPILVFCLFCFPDIQQVIAVNIILQLLAYAQGNIKIGFAHLFIGVFDFCQARSRQSFLPQ